jgi:hypothetical protein
MLVTARFWEYTTLSKIISFFNKKTKQYMSNILKLKSDAKAFIETINDTRVLESIVNIIDNEFFINFLKTEHKIFPVWVLLRVHISMLGNHYLTDVAYASKNKMKVANYMFENSGSRFEKKIIFAEVEATEINYYLLKSGLGYFNFGNFLSPLDIDITKYNGSDYQLKKISIT